MNYIKEYIESCRSSKGMNKCIKEYIFDDSVGHTAAFYKENDKYIELLKDFINK